MKTIKIFENVFVLKDSYDNCANLVVGKDRALLFDTCLGVENIREKVDELTQLPLIVINSHGHIDHVGGNTQFDYVYINPDDRCIFKNYNQQILKDWLGVITGKNATFLKQYDPEFNTRILDFDSFDLGNLKCFIIKLTGHTKGSIGVYIPDLKLLLSGDALMPLMTLYFDNYASIDEQLKTLNRASDLEFDFYLTGHSEKLYPKSFIQCLKDCAYNSLTRKHQFYKFPMPPYSSGFLYKDSTQDEDIGIIVADCNK